jgi:hypothetical protein
MIMALIAPLFALLPSLIALSWSAINDFGDGWGERGNQNNKNPIWRRNVSYNNNKRGRI